VSISVTVNGDHREVAPGTTVDALVKALGGAHDGRGVAVAVDGEVVPFSAWSTTPITDGARIEVVVAVQGG
jgi:sulfur carrier protein